MPQWSSWIVAAVLIAAGSFTIVPAQSETIEKVVVDGVVRISPSAVERQLTIKEGDLYDEEALRAEFNRLWELNLFDNITLEVRQGTEGKIVLWHVTDRPLVADLEYKGVKAYTVTQIEEKLKDQKAEIRRGSPIDHTRIQKARETIEIMLQQKGFLDAKVEVLLEDAGPGQQSLTFSAREGGKTKIKKIEFVGNSVFSKRQLKKIMKLTKEKGMFTWASSKDLYHPAKFDEDTRLIRQAYLNQGYLDVDVKAEVVEVLPFGRRPKTPENEARMQSKADKKAARQLIKAEERAAEAAEKKAEEEQKALDRAAKGKPARKKKEKEGKEPKAPKKWIYVTVPIQEGAQYRVGSVVAEGNSVFTNEEILAKVPLATGGIFDDSVVKRGLARIQLDYGEKGYFYVTANQIVNKKEGNVADLKIEINEDKQYRINTIEFAGNTITRDKVLRREVRIAEEDLFDLKRFQLGLRKINQLGYWQITEEASIVPRPEESKVDIVIKGQEASRNEIQVGGGVSGLDGAFFSGSYATRNFLGRGEILQTSFQVGGRVSRYSLSFIEPWFLERPYTVGFSVFSRDENFRDFDRRGKGASVRVGRLLGPFSRFDTTYLLEEVQFTGQSSQTTSKSRTSSVIPVYTYDTRNNFFRPSRGFRLQFAMEVAGGALGGDNYFVKPSLQSTVYLPSFGRHYIGLNGQAGYVESFGGRQVPTFERFFLGGERSLRVFETRTITPHRDDVDLNQNGFLDVPEDRDGDGILDINEDLNGNGILDTEDLNGNGILDSGEDLNGNGTLDSEDADGDGRLDISEDINGNGALDPGEDTNGDGVLGRVFPGGNKFVLFNVEYVIPLGDTFEFVTFLDAGNAFDDNQDIDLSRLRTGYGVEFRFHLPVFGAPLRFIYGFINDPEVGEDSSSFIFSIGSTF